jgi:hypothetical protein
MSKFIVAQNNVVTNIVNAPPADPNVEYMLLVDDSYAVNVGDPFDPKDWQVNPNTSMTQADYVSGQVLFNHENRLRNIVLAIRLITSTVTGAQAANNVGLPTNAQSQQVTATQFKNAVKGLLP